MTECSLPQKSGRNRLTIGILLFLVAIGIIGTYLSLTITNFSTVFLPAALPGEPPYTPGGAVYEAIYVVLTIAADMLYIVGGGIVAFGAILAGYRFVQCKLTSPYKPSCVTHFLSGYLTLGLELFIGAEIIKTVVVRTATEFELLILVIFSRGLFSLILYLERRWHGTIETE